MQVCGWWFVSVGLTEVAEARKEQVLWARWSGPPFMEGRAVSQSHTHTNTHISDGYVYSSETPVSLAFVLGLHTSSLL